MSDGPSSAPPCGDVWPKNDVPLPRTRCRLDSGHDGPHSNGQSAWGDDRRWWTGDPTAEDRPPWQVGS